MLTDINGDGKRELYVTTEQGEVWRVHATTSWRKTLIGAGKDSLQTLVVGDGDNDVDREVYAGSTFGRFTR